MGKCYVCLKNGYTLQDCLQCAVLLHTRTRAHARTRTHTHIHTFKAFGEIAIIEAAAVCFSSQSKDLFGFFL